MIQSRPLTSLEIIGAGDRALVDAGYRQVPDPGWVRSPNAARVYEDVYGVVGLLVFDSVEQLERDWPSAQSDLVDLLSRHLSRDDAKAWDGYLVLFTGALEGRSSEARLSEIRRDTSRVRKIVATGDQLRSLVSVERALLPLLPLDMQAAATLPGSALELLPNLLAAHGISLETSSRLVAAFGQQSSLMRALQSQRDVE
jgi:hypothetical protein